MLVLLMTLLVVSGSHAQDNKPIIHEVVVVENGRRFVPVRESEEPRLHALLLLDRVSVLLHLVDQGVSLLGVGRTQLKKQDYFHKFYLHRSESSSIR